MGIIRYKISLTIISFLIQLLSSSKFFLIMNPPKPSSKNRVKPKPPEKGTERYTVTVRAPSPRQTGILDRSVQDLLIQMSALEEYQLDTQFRQDLISEILKSMGKTPETVEEAILKNLCDASTDLLLKTKRIWTF